MPTKVNFVLDDDVKEQLESLVDRGKRSRVINDALRRELRHVRRSIAVDRLDELRVRTRPMTTGDLLRSIRSDRGRDGKSDDRS
jgi:Arc/MetJ-type ribon-helix-helix transcriptional regulator